MFIFVDPTGEKLKMELWNQEKVLETKDFPADNKLSQNFLSWIDEFLGEHSVKKENLKGLVVVKGPGSFTTLRVVISTLNALAYTLDVPVLGIKKGEGFSEKLVKTLVKTGNFKDPATPYYKDPPKTTKPKKNVI